MKKIKSKVLIREMNYTSIMKKYWNDACKKVNELTAVHDTFKIRMRELQRSKMSELKYKSEFISIVNMTYGAHLGVMAEDFVDCKYVLKYAKKRRIALNDICKDLKYAYQFSTDSVYSALYEI